ncbi:MAG: hypothetical protein FWE20_01760 [Defluviitaleaceae bacterium]|nr:hypothetical protein [Defluviitaleaceae bacterium]
MKIVKKRIALIMAFVMMWSSVTPITALAEPLIGIDPLTVVLPTAPGGSLRVDSRTFLQPGGDISTSPNRVDPNPPTVGNAPLHSYFMSWPVDITTEYRLSFFLTNTRRADLTVVPSGGALDVFYEVFDITNGGDIRSGGTNMNATGPHGFMIHHAAGPGTALFRPITPQAFIEGQIMPIPIPGLGIIQHVLDFDYRYGRTNDFGAEDEADRPPGEFLFPMFRIQQGQGFSFRYLNEEIHFRWDLATDEFEFSINAVPATAVSGIHQGRIYDFWLFNRTLNNITNTANEHRPSENAADWLTWRNSWPDDRYRYIRAISSLDLARVQSIPRSNYPFTPDRDRYPDLALTGNPPPYGHYRASRDAVIGMDSAAVLENNEHPGARDVSLEFRVPLPTFWGTERDAAGVPTGNHFYTNNPLYLPGYPNELSTLDLRVDLVRDTGQPGPQPRTIGLRIYDIFGLGDVPDVPVLPNDPTHTFIGGAEEVQLVFQPWLTSETVTEGGVTFDRHFVVFEFMNRGTGEMLAPSVIFEQARIWLVPQQGDMVVRQSLASMIVPQRIYTLLEFWPEIHDNFYHIAVNPYSGHRGYYVLHVGDTRVPGNPFPAPPGSHRVFSDGTEDFILFTTGLSVMELNSPEALYFRVEFIPEGTVSPGIMSQWLYFRPYPQPGQISSPQMFNIINVQHTPVSRQVRRDEGVLEMTMQWDIGSQEIIRGLLEQSTQFDAAGNPYIVIGYDVRFSLSHDVDDPDHDDLPFLWVPIRITSGSTLGITATLDGDTHWPGGPPEWPSGMAEITIEPGEAFQVGAWGSPPRFQVSIPVRVNTYHIARQGTLDRNGVPIITTPGNYTRYPLFPFVHFFNVRPVLQSGVLLSPIVAPSEYRSVTLSDLTMPDVPPPQNVTIPEVSVVSRAVDILDPDTSDPGDPRLSDHHRVSFDIHWEIPRQGLRNFLRYSYRATPASLTLNMYISANEDFMVNTFANRGWPQRADADDVATVGMPGPRIPHQHTEEFAMYFSGSVGEADADGNFIPIDPSLVLRDAAGTEARELLRQTALPGGPNVVRVSGVALDIVTSALYNNQITLGEIAAWLETGAGIDDPFPFRFTLDGLDNNERYFIFLDLVVSYEPPYYLYDQDNDPILPRHQDASLLSPLTGVTTQSLPDVPTGEDMVPPAPQLDYRDVGSDTATVFWPPITDVHETAAIEYEIIRIRSSQMLPPGLWDSRVPFAQIAPYLPADFEWVAFRTQALEPDEDGMIDYELLQWIGGNSFTGGVDPDDFSFSIAQNPETGFMEAVFVDNTVLANEIYFYYVRTVRTMNVTTTFSVWSFISVTTYPIGRPIRLTPAPELMREQDDPMTEIWLGFDVPLQSLDMLGTYRHLQLQVRADGEEWQPAVRGEDGQWVGVIELDPDTLINGPFRPGVANPPADIADSERPPFTRGYRFFYLASGLAPGTTYQFRVRMIDQVGNASMWSNIATWITELDQDQAEDDRAAEDWRRWLRDEMYRLLRTPYWVAVNTEHVFEAIFRPTMTSVILNSTPDSQIRLPSSPFDNVNRTIYHIPMSVYQAASSADMGFVAINGDMRVMLPPNFIDLANNPAVLAMRTAIDNRDFADSIIRVSIGWADYDEVDGNETLSRVADIDISIIGASQGITAWDNNLRQSLEDYVERWANDPQYFQAILNAVRSQVTNQDISRYLLAVLEATEANIVSVVNRAMSNMVRSGFEIGTTDRAMQIILTGLDANVAVQGLMNFGAGWLATEVGIMGVGRGFPSNRAGRHVFTGRIVVIPGIGQYARGGTVTEIVARFGLDDFMGVGNIDINAPATREMVVGSVARLSGSPRGADPVNWMRQQGINVPARNLGQEISGQEAVALIMHVYEVRTGTGIATIRIRNNNAINGIGDFDPSFTESLRAALELGIIDQDSFNPRERLLIRDLLRMLDEIDRNVRV